MPRQTRQKTTITSVWEGSHVYVPTAQPTWAPNADPVLRSLFDSGSPLIICGRNSSTSPRAGARAAAIDLLETAREELTASGLDVTECLPPVDEMVTYLESAPNYLRSVSADGASFKNRFVLIDIRSINVVLSLSYGSARKLDASFDQPHIEWLQMLFSDPELRPRGLVAKRFDRLSRDEWAIGPLRQQLASIRSHEPVWVRDGTHRVWTFDDGENVSMVVNGQRGRQDAEQLQDSRFRGYRTWTDGLMVDGRVRFGAAAPMPPGLFRYVDTNTHRTVMAIDEARCYPRVAASALPDVRDANGNRVCQADNVCWALSQFGGTLTVAEVIEELMRRRYSTDTLRSRTGMGPAAYYGAENRPGSDWWPERQVAMARTIFANLDMYKTGRFVVRMGKGRDPLVVENVFPERGYWATAADFARIDAWLEPHRVTRQRANWSWSGMPVSVNGVATSLRRSGASENDGADATVRWSLIPDVADRDALAAAVVGKMPVLDDRWLTAMILDGVLAADGEPMRRFVEGSDSDRQARMLQDRSELQVRETQLGRDMAELRAQLSERDPETGARLVKGRLLGALNDDYESLGHELERVQAKAATVAAALAEFRPQQQGVAVEELQRVLNGLANPKTNEYRDALRDAVRDLRLESVPVCSAAGFRGVENTLTGTVVVGAAGESWGVDFSGSFLTGPIVDETSRVADAERSLRAGVVMVGVNQNTDEYRAYRAFLGGHGRDISAFTYASCRDRDLLRLGVAVLCPPPPGSGHPTAEELSSDAGLVGRFGDLDALIGRLRVAYGVAATVPWLIAKQQTHVVEHLVRIASDRSGELSPAEVRRTRDLVCTWGKGTERWERPRDVASAATLRPCAWCGSLKAGPMRLREVTGYVCLEPGCRRDEAGVRWDPSYDRYLHAADLWVAAGVDLDVPDGFTGSIADLNGLLGPRMNQHDRLRERNLAFDDLTPEQRTLIAEEYRAGETTSTALAFKWRLLHNTLMKVVDAEGVPRRALRGRQRYTAKRPRKGAAAGFAVGPVVASDQSA